MNRESLLKVILSQHLSEKVVIGMEKRNEYVFKVIKEATKLKVKQAIQMLFNVKVKAVRIVNVRPVKKMFRNIEGSQKGWKKAYVTLQSGEKLDLLSSQQ